MKGSHLKQNVKKLISKTKTMEALELINLFITKSVIDYNNLEKTVYIRIANLNNVSKQLQNGIYSHTDYNDEMAKINFATLNMLDDIDDDDEAILELDEMIT